jgi:hypothetical protein
MPTISPAKAQTLRQAKKAYKVTGTKPQLSERERIKLERELVLADRAEQARNKERRRQEALKRKAAKDDSEKEARKRAGIGLATQLVGYSHSQKSMKLGMEQFVRASKIQPDLGLQHLSGAESSKSDRNLSKETLPAPRKDGLDHPRTEGFARSDKGSES